MKLSLILNLKALNLQKKERKRTKLYKEQFVA